MMKIKELLAPIVLGCITQIEDILPLKSVIIKYYHPAFHPDEKGMTWRTMKVSLDQNAPRTMELLNTAELIEDNV